jgi:hypothetical protein
MSGDKFKKAQAGRPLEIPASTWNAMVDAARSNAESQHDQRGESDSLLRQGDIIKVRNQSGRDLDRFAVLGIYSPIILPSVNDREFKNQVAINVVLPTEDHSGQFVILLDPMRAGRMGRAWVSGVCPARINVDEDWHQYVDIEASNSNALKSKPDGAAQILWREPGLGLRWAVVRLSNHHRKHYLARIPTSGIPARRGLQTGSANCELFTVDDAGLLEPVQRPGGATVRVVVRHHGTQGIRGPIAPDEPQYLGVTFDGRDSWLLDPPKQTLLCKPLGRRSKASLGVRLANCVLPEVLGSPIGVKVARSTTSVTMHFCKPTDRLPFPRGHLRLSDHRLPMLRREQLEFKQLRRFEL